MSAAEELQAAIEALAQQPFSTELTFDEIRADYEATYGRRGANAAMAADAGYPPVSRRVDPVGWRQRQSFLKRIQRYESGQRKPSKGWLEQFARTVGSQRAPGTVAAALHEISRHGVGVVHIRVKIRVSNEKKARPRRSVTQVYIDPEGDGGEELERFVEYALEGRWELATYYFAQAWGAAYGINGEVHIEELEGLELTW